MRNKGLVEYKGWKVVRKIGAGSFGTVYEIEKEDFGYSYKAALKVISIPGSDQETVQISQYEKDNDDSLDIYYESVASEIVKEFELMYKLRGFSNIVSYEDHEIRKHENGIGWDIMIRMELLTPLNVYMQTHSFGRDEVIRLGIDMCKALERCENYNVIHRDIKPANIFVSEQGDFKLGDFGIARTLETHDTLMELSRKGTVNYMAPEILKGEKYDFTVDMYSLGIVMYRLLNDDTLPFVPLPPQKPTYQDINHANQRRFRGDDMPNPKGDNTQLADVIKKACSFHPADRYQSPADMREDLEMLASGKEIAGFDDHTILLPQKDQIRNTRWRKKLIFAAGVLILSVSIVAGVLVVRTHEEKESVDEFQVNGQTQQDPDTEEVSALQSAIRQKDFVTAYRLIQSAVQNGENLDEDIQDFVYACEEELEYKRAVAGMKLLSDNISDNESFYRETIQWFYGREQEDLARQILSDLREKGSEGVNLADSISLDNNLTQTNEEEQK